MSKSDSLMPIFLIMIVMLLLSIGGMSSAAVVQQTTIIRDVEPVILRHADSDSLYYVPASHLTPQMQTQAISPPATITVNFLIGGGCGAWPAAAMNAYNFAVTVWEGFVRSALPIMIDACWRPFAPMILGTARPTFFISDFPGAPLAGRFYPPALANALAGFDLDPSISDIDTDFNSAFTRWHFDPTTPTPATLVDFTTVVMHEIGHGLGMTGNFFVLGAGGWSFADIYDNFVVDAAGDNLFNTTQFPNFSVALANALQSDAVFFNGPNAVAANGGPVALHAPPTFANGSSISHLREPTFNGTPDALMTPFLNSAEQILSLGPVTRAILQDLGWNTMGMATATLGNFVWFDDNRNGLQDIGELGIDGITVNLYLDNFDGASNPARDFLLDSVVTSGGGFYAFPNLIGTPNGTGSFLGGGDFVIEIIAPPGQTFTQRNAGLDATIDSDVRGNGRTNVFALAGGVTNFDVDAGLVPAVLSSPAQQSLPPFDTSVAHCIFIGPEFDNDIRMALPDPNADLQCRVIAINRDFIRDSAEVGHQVVLDAGVIHAVDVFSPSGASAAGVRVCLRGTNFDGVFFLNALNSPRTLSRLPANLEAGFVCATLPAIGTIVLTEAEDGSFAMPVTSFAAPVAVTTTQLVNCRVTTDYILNLRASPDINSPVVTLLPFGTTYTTTELSSGWYRIIYRDMQGWLTAELVSTTGDCG